VDGAAIVLEDVGVRFLFDRNRRVVTPTLARLRRRGVEAWGLRNVTLSIEGGTGLALVGSSGSGKTTMLRLLAGVYPPDEGSALVRGQVGSLLSTDTGLLPVLTGRENATLLGVLYGLPRSVSRASLELVNDQAKLEERFDRPVSTYSHGMRARLGFAVAERSDPEILLLDEVHEVLDHEYRRVLEHRAAEILEEGGIVIAVGHDHPMLESLCQRAIWLDEGRIRADGPFTDVQSAYLAEVDSTPTF
jgi:lipopolysaccharide transport system ATP-binding protein